MSAPPMVSLHRVAKSYTTVHGDVPVLADLDLRIDRGEKVSLVGPSGSGKSTLLGLISGLLRPDAGMVAIDGVSLADLDDAALADLRSHRIGIALQSENMIPFLSAAENVALALGFGGCERGRRRTRAGELLERMSVGHRADHLPRRLSGGEAQRVAMAVALANEPDRTTGSGLSDLDRAVTALRAGPGAGGALQIDTRTTVLAKDQSSLAALNIRGLLDLDSGYALAMGTVTVAIFVFGLLLQRRREYVTLRAQGVRPSAIRVLITLEAGVVGVLGCVGGMVVGWVMGWFLVNVLRPLFVLPPPFRVPVGTTLTLVVVVLGATVVTSLAAPSLVNRLQATELLRDE